jgi:serine/threonine protein kinase
MLIGDLTLQKRLGKGAFGEVYLTSKQGCKEKFATKKIDKKFASNPRAKKYLDNEIAILKEIKHQNIIKLYEVQETTQFYYLVMEYCNGGGLSDCLDKYKKKFKKPFPEETVQYLMRQIISAINYLHKKGILHRDIKLDNILLNYENEEDRKNNNIQKAQVKIIDFGFARHLEPAQLAYSTLGSPINMDPGILRKLNKMENSRNYGYDQKADIWSLGTICYEMLIGKCTFDAESMKELVSKVERGNYFLPTYLSKEAVSFLNGMLQYDLKKRLSADQLENHKFLTKPYNELTKINLKEAQKNIIGSQLKINSKINQSIWVIFETDENEEDLNSISPNMYEQNSKKNYSIDSKIDDTSNKKKQNEIIEINNKQIDEKELIKKFLDAFDEMNDDFIYVEPKLIPIIPGDDPSVINKVSEFSEDNF